MILINKLVKCEICVDSIFVFKKTSYNKNVLKLCYAINTDEMMMVCCIHAAYMQYIRIKYILIK